VRIEGDAGFCSQGFDLLDISVKVRTSLNMDRDVFGARLPEGFDVSFRLYDHQMDIERLGGMSLDGLTYRQTEGYVGYKYTVHNVDMDPVGFAFVQHFYLPLQVCEV